MQTRTLMQIPASFTPPPSPTPSSSSSSSSPILSGSLDRPPSLSLLASHIESSSSTSTHSPLCSLSHPADVRHPVAWPCLAATCMTKARPPIMSTPSVSDGQLTPSETDTDILLTHGPYYEDDLWPTSQDVAEMAIMLNGSAAPLSWDRHSLKRLPRGARPVKLIGEGAANAVFELALPEGYPPSSEFKGWLLRVAKTPTNGAPPRYNYLKQQEFYADKVKSHLKDHVIQQELVVVRDSDIVYELNAFLRRMDHQRKEKFRGSFIAQTNWGFLVEDMRPTDPTKSILIEFKPKWLNQSPTAPSGAIRCRQCAMELYNFVKDPSLTRSVPETKPCPLVLDNPDAPLDISSPFRLAPQLAKLNSSTILSSLYSAANHQVIQDLREVQKLADPHGPLNASKDDPMFNFAMTVRDCTCFVQIFPDKAHPGPEGPIRLRLGDFDFKDTSVKFERWQAAERNLISSGCYTADWILCDGKYYHPPTMCLLEWTRRQGQPLHIINIQDKTRREPGLSSTWRDFLDPLESKGTIRNLRSRPALLKVMLQRFSKDSPKAKVCPYRTKPMALPIQW
ncbi:inositol-pentakisphosphate 2-kinase-domain-containing protein [Ilyonectria robusta]|uniref:inositol-pentakisphosphate 2-kinase-domain-containing protein n=1 Tax=Ilyonectria robusta TaxID=1079257 RepID=UPI001E8D3A5A|nr:inositol-pentakisphosphate 2-kinase-domain-containing protein [Ilyonectria robusta]KAH8737834.1 inositol-pentakisphosphate 2-kinase-domain-containing protein [Ilyonectria robusta]